MTPHTESKGAWFILAAALLWGTTGTAQAIAPPAAQPMVLGALRQILGALFLALIALGRGQFRRNQWRNWPWKTSLLAAVSVAAYQLFFFSGVAKTGVAVGTLAGIGSVPIWGGVLGFLARGERPSTRWAWATLFSIIGIALLVVSSGDLRVNGTGILLAVAAGGGYASYSTFSKGVMELRPPEATMAVIFMLGALLLLPVLFINRLDWVVETRGTAVVLHLGFITMALAYSLFARGLRLVPVATAMTLTLAEPLTAGVLGVVLLGEQLSGLAFVGAALLFLGLAALSLRPSPRLWKALQ